ncbi:MAG TPA: zf-HC2 domain-containing protein [Planktothrix sp.]|jgi:anti-sigma factor RsiW
MFRHEDCNRIQPLLDAYIDGELSAAESQAVDMHLSSCDACKRSLTEIAQVVGSLKQLRPVAPRDFADDFETVLAAKSEKEEVCNSVAPILDAFYDKELNQSEGAAVAKHLDTCLNCRGDLGDINRIAISLRELPPIQPPYDLASRFDEILAKKTRVVPFKRPIVWGALSAVAAAAVALAFHFVPDSTPGVAPNAVATNTTIKHTTAIASKPVTAPTAPKTGAQQSKAPALTHTEVANALTAPANKPEKAVPAKQSPAVAQLPPYDEEAASQHSAAVKSKAPAPAREIAQLPAVPGADSAAPEIASYDPEQSTSAEELGLSTDEDGLYAIKL